MRLLFTPNPDYIHKVLVVAYEAGVLDRLTFERQVPFDADTTVGHANPLGKVPTLIMDDGEPLYGGLVICEYLDSLSVTGKRVFPQDDSRWLALRQMTTGDGMFDATTNFRVESWREKALWNLDYMQRERTKILRCLDQMERDAQRFDANTFHIGHICCAGGLSYLELRNPIRETALQPGDEAFQWREGRPALSAWYDRIQSRASIAHRYFA
jgi:glutathione S-transferase